MKVCEKCGEEISTKDGENRCPKCEAGVRSKTKRAQRAADRKARDQAMKDIGMKKVRGTLGGTYWE